MAEPEVVGGRGADSDVWPAVGAGQGVPPDGARLALSQRLLRMMQQREPMIIGTSAGVLIVCAWQVFAMLHVVSPLVLASPIQVAVAIVRLAHQKLFTDLEVSGVEFLIGFALSVLIGIPLGLAIGWNRRLYYAANPVLAFLNATPRVALLPLLVLWVGIGIWSKVLLVVLGASFPILINTIAGVRSVDESLLQVAQAFRARGLFIFRTVVLPASVPFVLSGLRLGVGRGILMVVVAEFYASYNGIGHLISHAAQTLDAAESFAGVVVIALVGAICAGLIGRIETRFEKWRPERR